MCVCVCVCVFGQVRVSQDQSATVGQSLFLSVWKVVATFMLLNVHGGEMAY